MIRALAVVGLIFWFGACSLTIDLLFAPSWHYLLVGALATIAFAVVVIRGAAGDKK